MNNLKTRVESVHETAIDLAHSILNIMIAKFKINKIIGNPKEATALLMWLSDFVIVNERVL